VFPFLVAVSASLPGPANDACLWRENTGGPEKVPRDASTIPRRPAPRQLGGWAAQVARRVLPWHAANVSVARGVGSGAGCAVAYVPHAIGGHEDPVDAEQETAANIPIGRRRAARRRPQPRPLARPSWRAREPRDNQPGDRGAPRARNLPS